MVDNGIGVVEVVVGTDLEQSHENIILWQNLKIPLRTMRRLI